MAFPYSVHKTYVSGEILTASDLNSTDVNHINNNIPEAADDYSANVAEMQSTVDPYPASSESLPTTLAGELERIRFQIKAMLGETHWYYDPDNTIAALESDKAEDSLVVHKAGTETITGAKTFQDSIAVTDATEADVDITETGNSITLRHRATNSGSFSGTVSNHDYDIRANNVAGVTLDASNGSAASITGTTTNDSAATGIVGESVSSNAGGFTNFPATGTYGDATSISLTAGDWDVTMQITASQNGATWSNVLVGVSTTSGNSGSGLTQAHNHFTLGWASSSSTPQFVPITIANYRVSLSSTTTHYAKVRATYSAGTPQYAYRLSARRVR